MLNLWINVYLTLKMCCSFSWHNKQSVCAGWDMARLAKFFAFQTENPKFREGYEKTLCHWLGYCFGLASHWWFFFFFWRSWTQVAVVPAGQWGWRVSCALKTREEHSAASQRWLAVNRRAGLWHCRTGTVYLLLHERNTAVWYNIFLVFVIKQSHIKAEWHCCQGTGRTVVLVPVRRPLV